jgi:hypothetical protein
MVRDGVDDAGTRWARARARALWLGLGAGASLSRHGRQRSEPVRARVALRGREEGGFRARKKPGATGLKMPEAKEKTGAARGVRRARIPPDGSDDARGSGAA